METIGFILTLLGGLTALLSAIGKLTGQDQVIEMLDHVGATGALRTSLPFLQIAGGAGALVSLFVLAPLGVVALGGLALYFVGAVLFHVRVGDKIAGYGIPLGLAVFMAAAAGIRLATI